MANSPLSLLGKFITREVSPSVSEWSSIIGPSISTIRWLLG